MIQLTQKQAERYDTVRWLVNEGPRASGRTTLLALAFLEKAYHNQDSWVRVFDHTQGILSNHINLTDRISELFYKDDEWLAMYYLTIDIKAPRIKVSLK